MQTETPKNKKKLIVPLAPKKHQEQKKVEKEKIEKIEKKKPVEIYWPG